MSTEPSHFVGAVPPEKSSDQLPNIAPSSSGEFTAADKALDIFIGSLR